jgi:hypothetical protein
LHSRTRRAVFLLMQSSSLRSVSVTRSLLNGFPHIDRLRSIWIEIWIKPVYIDQNRH